ncbi:MAG: hypothetical protein A6F71_10875 [Cycloclasticus sp. symbiont of Poecilosclerida sp. M]|nr:MAG: hypothetical protein A6F71_10875 [Cycloclasticus sp. symbiont of Poecilosclerida sp. M]
MHMDTSERADNSGEKDFGETSTCDVEESVTGDQEACYVEESVAGACDAEESVTDYISEAFDVEEIQKKP